MDYASPDRRRSKNDKRAKSRFNRFKRGGANRSLKLPNRSSPESAQGS